MIVGSQGNLDVPKLSLRRNVIIQTPLPVIQVRSIIVNFAIGYEIYKRI